MARNKKRSDGRLQKSFTFNGKRYYVNARTKEELDKKLYEKRQEVEQGKEQRENPTIEHFYNEIWVKARQGIVTPATLRSQQCHYNTMSKIVIDGKEFKDYKLSEVKADDIRTIQKVLLENNSVQTVNDKVHFLSHIFADAVKEQYITYNPCAPVRTLKRTDEQARDTIHRALTIEETHKFFEAAQNSYYYNIYRFAINTGMRIGEIGGLKNSDIYDGKIHVERTITRLEDGSYTLGDNPKTWHGKRVIPLNNAIKEILESQRKINVMLDGNVSNINDLIFKAPERGLLMSTPVDRDLKRICKRTGLEHFTAHAFRATFATRCIEQLVPVKTLQELLGHADYGMTMNLYGHAVDDSKEQAMNDIDIAL
nr:site-specific integrase [uncultured Butyrivibrio sp.]